MIVLRDYQQRAVDEVRQATLDGHKAVLFQLATGGGKTLTAGYILASAAAKGNRGMFICNRVELLEQTAKAFDRLDLSYGIVAAGFTPNPRAPVQIASIDTLKRRLDKIAAPRLIVWDECRSLGSAGWTNVFKTFPNAVHLGLDATPIRLDGKGLGEYFTHLVCGPTYSELMARGSLVPFDCFCIGVPDLSGIRTKGKDYDQDQAEAALDKPQLVGDVAAHYKKHAEGKLGITFAISRKHSEHLAAAYRDAGVPAVHLDGDTDKNERKKVVAAFRRGEIRVLCNVDLFSAGFDVPGVEVVTMVRPTKSLAMFLQQAGRGSRPEPDIGKTRCLLFDHVGNVLHKHGELNHGWPDMDREWSLEGVTKRKRKKGDDEPALAVRQCESCFAVFRPAPVCPVCGAEQKIQAREIEQVDGELTKITPEMRQAIAVAKKREVGMARSLDDLKRIEAQRGYKKGWAEFTFAARENAAQRRVEAQARAYGRLGI